MALGMGMGMPMLQTRALNVQHPALSHRGSGRVLRSAEAADKARPEALPLPQLLSLHRLHPLSRSPEAPPRETRAPFEGQDDMFGRQRDFPDGEWSDKSALRKIWEQNKIMLS